MDLMHHDLRTQTLDLINAQPPVDAGSQVAALINAWLVALDEEDLAGTSPDTLAPVLWAGFTEAASRHGQGCQIAQLRYADGRGGMASALLIINDDMPYPMRAASGVIHSMPHPIDIDDTTILVQNHHTENDFRDQLCDQFDVLYRESATQGGRVMAISLHPWVIGQPYRIGALEEALQHIMGHTGVWAATGGEILDAWKASQA